MTKWLWLGISLLLSFQSQARKQWRNPNPASLQWEHVSTGLSLSHVDAPIQCNIGDSRLTILRIEPKAFDFQLLSTKELHHSNLTATQWAKKYSLTALVNAGMYQSDYQTNVGYMRNYSFVNNERISKDNTILVFNPKNDSLPPVQIIDRTCQNWEYLLEQYQSATQGIRMIDCGQKNRWSKQSKYWSMVVIAIDKKGRVLMIHSRTPYSVHDFIDMIKELPLDIYNAMYLEGGPEASFILNDPICGRSCIGSYETGFYESDTNDQFWPIPNVIGIVPKKK